MDILIVAEDADATPIEIPIETDGTLLFSTLQSQFPGASGLKYFYPEKQIMRGIRSKDGRLYPPFNEFGWGTQVYYCAFPKENGNKRKSTEKMNYPIAKNKCKELRQQCCDLIVLGLPWRTTETCLRMYFEQFGEVILAHVKKDRVSGQPKGFGFIHFASHEVQMRVLAKERFVIDGRTCEVRLPHKQNNETNRVSGKIFVSRCTLDITGEDLREYFSSYGEVVDVFIPTEFRGFGFVTFLNPEVAESLYGQDHIIKGVSVLVNRASSKSTNSHIEKLRPSMSHDAVGINKLSQEHGGGRSIIMQQEQSSSNMTNHDRGLSNASNLQSWSMDPIRSFDPLTAALNQRNVTNVNHQTQRQGYGASAAGVTNMQPAILQQGSYNNTVVSGMAQMRGDTAQQTFPLHMPNNIAWALLGEIAKALSNIRNNHLVDPKSSMAKFW